MKRFHVHLHVADLQANIRFYSALFHQPPARTETDYAKWMLDDPPVNFAISTRGAAPGLGHLGIQVDSDEELDTLKAQARQADLALLDEGETDCCYAHSDKHWLTDPQGLAWEQFRTLDSIPVFGQGQAATCCAPKAVAPADQPACCPSSSTSGASCC